MKQIVYLMVFLSLFGVVYAECSVSQSQKNITLYDFIEPSGSGAVCQSNIFLDGSLIGTKVMNVTGLFYSNNYSGLEYEKTYYAYISCVNGGDTFYSDCYFALQTDIIPMRTETRTETNQLNYRYYFEVNKTEEIKLFSTNTNESNVYITIDSTIYKMTNKTDYFNILLTNPSRQDVDFAINKTDLVNVTTYETSGKMRWRIPFYVEISVYKTSKSENGSTAYKNQFQYIFLKKIDNKGAFDISWAEDINSNILQLSGVKKLDSDLALWGDYLDGKTKIKVYEYGNYSVNLETTKTRNSLPWKYEFIYPQNDQSNYFKKIASLLITEESDQKVKIYASIWEIDSIKAFMEYAIIFAIIMVYISLVVFACFSHNIWIISTVTFGGFFIMSAIIGSILG